MQVISKAAIKFILPETEDTKQKVFKLPISPDPVDVPDWVTHTEHFELLTKDRTVIIANNHIGETGKPTQHQLDLMDDNEVLAEVRRRKIVISREPQPSLVPDLKTIPDLDLLDELDRRSGRTPEGKQALRDRISGSPQNLIDAKRALANTADPADPVVIKAAEDKAKAAAAKDKAPAVDPAKVAVDDKAKADAAAKAKTGK